MIMSKPALAGAAVLAALLASAAPAHAGTFVGNPDRKSGVVESIAQKYTMFLPLDAVAHGPLAKTSESAALFSGDAYVNEMG
jgi:hypothetical protein